ncbi:MAG: nucleotide exchange factor GrpE [Acidobacteria bacterium]|nr:nucleotide exchange factor GrpE [Acidobacteriota bacterium]
MNDDPNTELPVEPSEAPEAAEAEDPRRKLQEQVQSLLVQAMQLEQERQKLEQEKQALVERCEKIEEEKRAMLSQTLRRQADLENYRKRAEREKQEFRARAEVELLTQLLPVVDAFERALAAETANTDDYRAGVELIYKQLADLLARAGLEPISAAGEPFDPNRHHAVERVETTDFPDHTVIAEVQRGYTFKQQLVRPALVRVAVHPEGKSGSERVN